MNENDIKLVKQIGQSRPTLTQNNVPKVTWRRALAIAEIISNNYSDCVSGVWLSPFKTNTCAVELLIDTSLKAGELRRIALGEVISEIFDNERTPDDTYDVYYLDTTIFNEELKINAETALSKLENSFVIYLRER